MRQVKKKGILWSASMDSKNALVRGRFIWERIFLVDYFLRILLRSAPPTIMMNGRTRKMIPPIAEPTIQLPSSIMSAVMLPTMTPTSIRNHGWSIMKSTTFLIVFSFPNPTHSVWENYRKPCERLGNMPENSPANCDWNTGIILYLMIYVKYLQKDERYGKMNVGLSRKSED